jgi:hypothetical protein
MEIGVLDDGDERSWLRGEGKEMARGAAAGFDKMKD